MIYDVVVIGGGNAGLEAAAAAARIGAKVCLVTINKNNIGEMSCNPSIGGVGKGTIVLEIDALDGIIGKTADAASINYKALNKSKGSAVWGWRAQIDRVLYKKAVNLVLNNEYKNITIIEDMIEEISVINKEVSSVITTINGKISCKSVVVATGTFLSGNMFIGSSIIAGGRIGEPSATHITQSLISLGFTLKKLKTGTPARLFKDTINFKELEEQECDEEPLFFSSLTTMVQNTQLPCYITYTNKLVHYTIEENIDKSPIYSGQITSRGPRYCASIEDKVKRFSGRDRHQIFLEPEGLTSNIIYPNGISTSLPQDIQIRFLRQISGLENVQVAKYGYAVQYDYIDPIALYPTLETKLVKNLFFSGQINGTTGYEEAAGQGVIAGINAGLRAFYKDKDFTLNRNNSYIGVMIDDLTTVGVGGEPYRVFTSRAEYRLSIRGDNAQTRLTKLGLDIGCVSTMRKENLLKHQKQCLEAETLLKSYNMSPHELDKAGVNIGYNGYQRSAFDLLAAQVPIKTIYMIWPELKEKMKPINKSAKFETIANANYSNYIKRHETEIAKAMLFNKKLDLNLDYSKINGLSKEEVEKLNLYKPTSIHAAKKIPGITPVAITTIIHAIENKKKREKTT